jgi:hypothetical protein
MAGVAPHNDVLSRVRREQRLYGKDASFSGIRIVLIATGITVAILLFAFGAIGMLMMARSPQESVANKLEQPPFVAPQAQAPVELETQVPMPLPAAKMDRVEIPAPQLILPPTQAELEKGFAAQQPVPQAEPETTASIPPAPEQAQQPEPQVKRNVVRPRPQVRQQQVQRPVRDSQDDNPLFQLFGIRKYR